MGGISIINLSKAPPRPRLSTTQCSRRNRDCWVTPRPACSPVTHPHWVLGQVTCFQAPFLVLRHLRHVKAKAHNNKDLWELSLCREPHAKFTVFIPPRNPRRAYFHHGGSGHLMLSSLPGEGGALRFSGPSSSL